MGIFVILQVKCNQYNCFHKVKRLVDILRDTHHLEAQDYAALLSAPNGDEVAYLRQQAQQVAVDNFGHGIFVRGLVEVTNVCRNDCLYCGIRKSNPHIDRYMLTHDEVMQCCQQGHDIGFHTFVLQGGELPRDKAQWIEELVTDIRASWPDCAITLSLGEWPREVYERWHRAGADRYLLRHETHNLAHYATLHPASMSLTTRLQCLDALKQVGYQVGTGIMVGSPGQTLDHLVEDIQYIEQLKPHMIGLGPFVPHHDTPLAHHPTGSADITTRLYAIFRLMFPKVLIPSTTALNSIDPNGRLMGIEAGANVVMPNLSPALFRDQYSLYDGKAATHAEAAEGIKMLQGQLATIGYHINWGRGDSPDFCKNNSLNTNNP